MSRIGYTTGVFDMFHVGHLNILRNARSRCDHLIVGVTTDALCQSRKRRVPVIPEGERLQILEAVRYVDEVVLQDSYDKLAAWDEHHFDVMFVGDDWRGTPEWDQYERQFADVGVEVVYFPYTVHTSSTLLRSALNDRVAAAATTQISQVGA